MIQARLKPFKEIKLRREVKEISNQLDQRDECEIKIQTSPCFGCDKFAKHYKDFKWKFELDKEYEEIETGYDRDQVSKQKEFTAKTIILKELEFIDETGMVLLWGRFSREISSADAIIITTFIFEAGFKELTIEDAGAILGMTMTKAGGKKLTLEETNFNGMSDAFFNAKDHLVEVA